LEDTGGARHYADILVMKAKIRRSSLLLTLVAVLAWASWHLLRDEPTTLTKSEFPAVPWIYTTTATETTSLHTLSDRRPQLGDADYVNSPYMTLRVSGDPDERIGVDGREIRATAFRFPDGKWLKASELPLHARFSVDRRRNRRLTADEVNRWQMRDYQERAERRLRSGLPYHVPFDRPLIGIQNQGEGR
jgi:hypothetical protein